MRSAICLAPAACIALLTFAMPTAAAEHPQPVSPGEPVAGTRVGSACPTFSWTTAAGAASYELAVWRLVEGATPELIEVREPVLTRTVPGGATTWTPALERCLTPGGAHVWSVRAVGLSGESGPWGEPLLFEVAPTAGAEGVDAAAGEAVGQAAGEAAGEPVGENAGEPVDEAIGQAAGEAVGATAGANRGDAEDRLRRAESQGRAAQGETARSPWTPPSLVEAPNDPDRLPPTETEGGGGSDLEIDGEFRFSSARTFSIWVPGNAFSALDPAATPVYLRTADGHGRPNPSGSVTVTAPLHFPRYSVLNGLVCYYYDNTASQDFNLITGTIRLYGKSGFATTAGTPVAELTFTTSLEVPVDATRSVSTGTFTPPAIDQFFKAYYLWASLTTNQSGSALRFYGCVVDFRVTTVNP